MKMDYTKRYWLFSYFDYYPNGGLDDLDETFDSIDIARNHFHTNDDLNTVDHAYILDRETGRILEIKQ